MLNGFVVVKLKTEPFIMTLGTGAIFQGFVLWVSDSNTVTNVREVAVDLDAADQGLGDPDPVLLRHRDHARDLVGAEHTPLGVRWLFVGKSRDVARLSGINSDRIRFGSFVAAGVLAAFAAVVFVGNSGLDVAGVVLAVPAARRTPRSSSAPPRSDPGGSIRSAR